MHRGHSARRFVSLSFLVTLLLAISRSVSFAQSDERPADIVIRGSLLREEAFSRSSVDAEDLQTSQAHVANLEEALRGVPGIEIVRTGGVGQQSSVFIRGTSSEHVLVLIDGLEINDPSNPTGAFDFSNFDLNNVETIEVFKGPQSLRFGSGAIGGVVNIVTKRGRGRFTPFVLLKGGAEKLLQGSVGSRGEAGSLNYSVSVSRLHSEGISSAAEELGYTEKDGADSASVAMNLGYDLNDKTSVELLSRYHDSRTELDYSPSSSAPYFIFADDPNYHVEAKSLTLGLRGTSKWSRRAKSLLALTHYVVDRSYFNDPDEANTSRLRNPYEGRKWKFENENELPVGDHLSISFGPSVRWETASSSYESEASTSSFPEVSESITGGSVRLRYSAPGSFATSGLRYDRHSVFGDHWTYALAPGYEFVSSGTIVEARLSTAFKSPSLYQLHDPVYGNSQLRPERAMGREVSLLQKFSEGRIEIELTGFDYSFEDLIQFATRYANVGRARVTGAELTARARSTAGVKVEGTYTYSDPRDEQNGSRLLRRSLNSWKASVSAPMTEQIEVTADYRGTGEKDDVDALTSARVTTGGYDVVNATLKYSFREYASASLTIENVFDRTYQELAGYGARRRSVFLATYAEF